MKPERFSEIQREPLFLDFIKELGASDTISGEATILWEKTKKLIDKNDVDPKYPHHMADQIIGLIMDVRGGEPLQNYSRQEVRQALEGADTKQCDKYWKNFILDNIIDRNYQTTDPETVDKIREIAVKQNSESYRHFGGCEAITDVKVINDSDGRIDIQVDINKYNELNKTKVEETIATAGDNKIKKRVGVGEYQVWRMSEAYASIKVSNNNNSLPIYINGVKWELGI
jgi:hypothetical protein